MSEGLQIFNSSGVVVLDISDDTGKTLGIANITANTAGSVTDARFSFGQPFWVILLEDSGNYPLVTYNSNTLSWNNGASFNGKITYGII